MYLLCISAGVTTSSSCEELVIPLLSARSEALLISRQSVIHAKTGAKVVHVGIERVSSYVVDLS
jgi:hypothetical protein